MRAVVWHSLVGPSAVSVDELEAPRPGPEEVVVDVRAGALNFPDLLL